MFIGWSTHVNYYFFMVASIYFYGKLFQEKLYQQIINYPVLNFYMKYQTIICFMLYFIGFMLFLGSLRKGFYRYQFRMLGWTHLIILITVVQTSAIVINIYEGMIWFLLPVIQVCTNDIFAYFFGTLFGRYKLSDITPRKTWEGYLGGIFSSLFISYYVNTCNPDLPERHRSGPSEEWGRGGYARVGGA